MKKRGLSPVVASVLLVAIVVVLAAILFLWARGFLTEQVAKFDQPVERSCDSVDFEANIFDDAGQDVLEVNNKGNVPIYGFVIKTYGTGTILSSEVSPSEGTFGIGNSRAIDIAELDSGSKILVVPIILGETGDGNVAYTCGDQYGLGIEKI